MCLSEQMYMYVIFVQKVKVAIKKKKVKKDIHSTKAVVPCQTAVSGLVDEPAG